MSDEIVDSIAATARGGAVEACWRQWRALGFPASATSSEPPRSIIDPEALVLLSLTSAPYERRLEDALAWWAETGAAFLSVQRIRSLARAFPASTRDRLGTFAGTASQAGDRRWRRYADGGTLAAGRRPRGPAAPTFSALAALMLRLRAGFGVGVKTDLLAYLIGCGSQGATIKEVKEAIAYTSPALRTAAAEMALAELIRTISDRPVRYVAQAAPWEALLGSVGNGSETGLPSVLPLWRDWFQFFAFAAYVLDWANQDSRSVYILSSRARDLVLTQQSLFTRHHIESPEPKHFRGEAYLEGFNLTVKQLMAWMGAHL